MSAIPSWVADAVFYQIFPERFENGDSANDPHGVQPWGDTPKPGNYFGGDLQGIINRLDHLKNLGINTLYLNPIFSAESNHKYNTKDYRIIDPAFGTNELFVEFLSVCHRNSLRVVIDGVFNHVGTAHFAFRDVKERGSASPYASWFNIYSFPVRDARHPNYECWWGHGSLPKLMVQHPDVKQYLFDVARYWTEKGIDGWRLDVPNELPHMFWKEWRTLVKGINPDCYIVGELWEDASPWLQGDEFDACMNYRFRQACIDYFAQDTISSDRFIERLRDIRDSYAADNNYAMQNLLGSHDTERYLTVCKEEKWRVHLSVIFQMTYLGAPMVYYGDEVGMTGGKDPDCRRCMVWDSKKWDNAVFRTTQSLIEIRRSSPALRKGSFDVAFIDERRNVFVVERRYADERVIVAFNKERHPAEVNIPVPVRQKKITDMLSGKSFGSRKGSASIVVPPHSARIFQVFYKE